MGSSVHSFIINTVGDKPGMGATVDDLQLTSSEIRKLRTFVQESEGLSQLTKARMEAIVTLSQLNDPDAPALGPQELVEFLKSSPLYEGKVSREVMSQLRDRRRLVAGMVNAAGCAAA